MRAFFEQPVIDDPEENRCWPDASESSCTNLDIKLKCSGIESPGGGPVTVGDEFTPSGWRLSTLIRATFDDRLNGALTATTFPLQFDIQVVSSGKIKEEFQSGVALYALFGSGSSLPPCSSLETISIQISDDTHAPFAAIGSATGGGQ